MYFSSSDITRVFPVDFAVRLPWRQTERKHAPIGEPTNLEVPFVYSASVPLHVIPCTILCMCLMPTHPKSSDNVDGLVPDSFLFVTWRQERQQLLFFFFFSFPSYSSSSLGLNWSQNGPILCVYQKEPLCMHKVCNGVESIGRLPDTRKLVKESTDKSAQPREQKRKGERKQKKC
jgi:hypothetical protein